MTLLAHQARLMAGGGGGPDPHWANVVSLLNFNGAHGSTDWEDEAGAVWTTQGNAKITHDRSRFGEGSLELDGDNAYIYSPINLSGQVFTMEAFAYSSGLPNTLGRPGSVFGNRGNGGNSEVAVSVGLVDGIITEVRLIHSSSFTATGPGVFTPGAFHHLAYVFDGGQGRIYLNGVNVLQFATPNGWNTSFPLAIGMAISTSHGSFRRAFRGNIDSVRITRGVARYTSDFIPPSQPFPNFGP